MTTDRELAADYMAGLQELQFNSKPIITNLTIIADQMKASAAVIAKTIMDRVREVKGDKKLPIFYLLDSIVKNVGGDYKIHFSRHLVSLFCDAFVAVDSKTRKSMSALLETWNSYFPAPLLQDIRMNVATILEKESKSALPTRQALQPSSMSASGGAAPSGLGGLPPHLVSLVANMAPQSQTILLGLIKLTQQTGTPLVDLLRQTIALQQHQHPTSPNPLVALLSGLTGLTPSPAPVPVPAPVAIPLSLHAPVHVPVMPLPVSLPVPMAPMSTQPMYTSAPAANNHHFSTYLPPPQRQRMTVANLKVRNESVISSIYNSRPHQCNTCGLRFSEQEKENLPAHLDWHFSQNHMKKQRAKRAVSRPWFVNLKDWLAGGQTLEPQAASFFESVEAKNEGEAVPKEDESSFMVPADDTQTNCPICGEAFETVWDDASSDWMYTGVVGISMGGTPTSSAPSTPSSSGTGTPRSSNLRIYHRRCYLSSMAAIQPVNLFPDTDTSNDTSSMSMSTHVQAASEAETAPTESPIESKIELQNEPAESTEPTPMQDVVHEVVQDAVQSVVQETVQDAVLEDAVQDTVAQTVVQEPEPVVSEVQRPPKRRRF